MEKARPLSAAGWLNAPAAEAPTQDSMPPTAGPRPAGGGPPTSREPGEAERSTVRVLSTTVTETGAPETPIPPGRATSTAAASTSSPGFEERFPRGKADVAMQAGATPPSTIRTLDAALRRRALAQTNSNGSPSPSLLANAISGRSGASDLAAAAAQSAPLTLQLLIPLLAILLLFSLVFLVAYVGGVLEGPQTPTTTGRSRYGETGRQHRRTASGDSFVEGLAPDGRKLFSPPRRGFPYSSSWSDGLPSALVLPASSLPSPTYASDSWLDNRPERRSPGRHAFSGASRGGSGSGILEV